MTSSNFKMEVLAGPERRRRWSTAEKQTLRHRAIIGRLAASLSEGATAHRVALGKLRRGMPDRASARNVPLATVPVKEIIPSATVQTASGEPWRLDNLKMGRTLTASTPTELVGGVG